MEEANFFEIGDSFTSVRAIDDVILLPIAIGSLMYQQPNRLFVSWSSKLFSLKFACFFIYGHDLRIVL